jgi:hypothetical protein
MKRSRIILLSFVLASALAAPAMAQKNSLGAELVYVDGNEFTVTYQDGTLYDYRKGGVAEGDLIPPGATIQTGAKTMAELRLKPNKSIIKLNKNTNFKIENLASASSGSTTSFALASGKIRVVAAKLSGSDKFKVKGQTAVCGVRGTDFTYSSAPGGNDRLVVKQGLVDLWRLVSGGSEDPATQTPVGAGQYADALPQGRLAALDAASDILNEAFGDMNFLRARETEVPGHEAASATPETASPSPSASPAASPAPVASAAASATPAPTQAPAQSPAQAASPQASPAAIQPSPSAVAAQPSPEPAGASGDSSAAGPRESVPSATPAAAASAASAAPSNPFMKWLSEFMNAEIGSISINDQTYAKAVLQPVIQLGKFRAALYLPIIYQQNLFDPDDWYHPQGNDEWSFGTDVGWRDNALGAFEDAAKDLALKIKFIEYGDQQFDPFFIKVGNFSDFTLGHGMLMKDYANDSEFPVIRRVGVDIGFNTANKAAFGLELLANDLSAPEIFGARVLLRPAKNSSLALGLSSIVDVAPAAMLDTEAAPNASDAYGDIALAGLGLDVDMPIMNTDLFSLKAFADAGAIMPYVPAAYSIGGNQVTPGFKTSMLWNPSENKAQNWGAMAGLLGNIGALFDWRLEYRYSTGSFTHNFFDRNYDANRGRIAAGYASILADPSLAAQQSDMMGIYGEGGFQILNGKLSLTAGYFWPWAAEYGLDIQRQMGVLSRDKLHLQLDIKKGLIPIVDVAGSISYDRTGFASALASDASSAGIWAILFDENTSFRGEVIVPIPKAPMLDLAMIFGTAPQRDAQGNVVFVDEAGLRPQMVPVFALETRMHF